MSKSKRRGGTRQAPTATAPAARVEVVGARARRGWMLAAGLVLAFAVAALAWWGSSGKSVAPPAPRPAARPAAQFVGAASCGRCHARQLADWQASQHAKAMQSASPETVLGNFANAKFDYHGAISTFFRRDGKYFVNTDGPDGKFADFQISHTFGIYPLQQYLVTFPDGRLQALSIAWDARARAAGGQRWYHLYPDERVDSKDPLHWTRLNQNWNWMCADCHTTHLQRNYDAERKRYATTWSEMNVACEACHGAGSRHVAWAGQSAQGRAADEGKGLVVALDERRDLAWIPVPATGNAVRKTPLHSQREFTACAQCHSRRAPMAKGMEHDGRFLDTHELALLNDAYFPDGQQRDEDYIVGSFLQSRMHAQGVTCSDCHNPHTGKLRAPGNAVCAQCHAPAKYDRPAHTLHPAASPGAQCASCHMPTRTYMGVDPRHDHSIRIPRPDLHASLQTPDACTGCHRDKSAAWAAAVIEKRFGPERKGFQTFGPAFQHARTGQPGAQGELLSLAGQAGVPAIVRASALIELRPYLDARVLSAIEASLGDTDPLVRGAALDALQGAPPAERLRLAVKLMDDPARIVRLKVARVMAVAPPGALDGPTSSKLEALFAEYVDSQRANADRPEAHVNLGLFYAERNDTVRAEQAYRSALALEPDFAPAYVNLADFYRSLGRESDTESTLEVGLRAVPHSADLEHSLGLLRVRQHRIAEALPHLQRAVQAAPQNSRYAYVYAVALHEQGQPRQAIVALEAALQRYPADPELLTAAATYAAELGDRQAAEAYSRRLSQANDSASTH